MAVNPVPEGHHTITPYIVVPSVLRLIEFLRAAFGARQMHVPMVDPKGRVMHAEVRIGDSPVMMGEPHEGGPVFPSMLYLYVADVDALYKQAVEAGATSIQEPTTQFYGDRTSGVLDPFGNQWWIGTHVEDVSPEELQRRHDEMAAKKS